MALSSDPLWSDFPRQCAIARIESDIWITEQNGCDSGTGICLPMHFFEFFLGYIVFEF